MVSDPRVNPLLNRLGGVYRDPNRVDRDASSLLKSSVGRHLVPNISSLVENNGDVTNTLCLKGTISIHFRAQEYQQLMDIYMVPGYPFRPPKCYVRLASNMYLKENHPHVGSDGQVYLPYLHDWRPSSHSLIELVVAMSSVFSADPPVFTRVQPRSSPPPPYSTTYTSSINRNSGTSQSERDAIAQVQEHIILEESRKEAECQQRVRDEEAQRKSQAEWDSQNHASTKEKVRRKLVAHLQEHSSISQKEIQTGMMDQKKLKLSQERVVKHLASLTDQENELEEYHKRVDEALSDIENLVMEAQERKQTVDASIMSNIDDMVIPMSAIDEQMLELSTKQATYTDVLYFLSNALHNHSIDLATLLKQVRKYARLQFLARAHLIKISQARAASQNGEHYK
mmetsp:Transcript_34255/g.38993  ORF Transcript_34255/g.38993 Transcript_34255/m.38993 type:complete len:397 (-) Transcript_34255:220-1410(-)